VGRVRMQRRRLAAKDRNKPKHHATEQLSPDAQLDAGGREPDRAAATREPPPAAKPTRRPSAAVPAAAPAPAKLPSHPPEWAQHAIWYQVMLDRFRNGNSDNDPKPLRPWTSEWFTPSPWEGRHGREFYESAYRRHYGGDLDGLELQLPYLRDLGVNALYLTPVFKAASYHKYNATSYIHVDDHFGTRGDYEKVVNQEDLLHPSTWHWTESDRRFLRFLRSAHSAGFRVIIDGVFNHVGTAHPAFRDVVARRTASPYARWFDVTLWAPLRYHGWWDHRELPVFKKVPEGYAAPEVKRHIFEITRRWMAPDGDPAAGIDGWRLDVPNEVPLPFWLEWCPFVRSINPQAYITGELWRRADEWLDGRSFDGAMNYEFARAVVAWVFDRRLKITVREFDRRLAELRQAYPPAITRVVQNLMNSHDTDRIASMAFNPDRSYNERNRPQAEGVHYNNAKPSADAYARARLAALIQMTYIGTPMIYYGDEVGMWGAADPTCRKPMLWKDLEPYERPDENHVMPEQLEHYRRIIALRNAHPVLRTGAFETLLCHDQADVWAFLRGDGDEQIVVAINASHEHRIVPVPLPTESPEHWQVVYGTPRAIQASEGTLPIEIPPLDGTVLSARGVQAGI
jgi:cyclomaltodextrinase